MLKQTRKGLKNFQRVGAGFGLRYDESNDLRREAWKLDEHKCFYNDRSEKKVRVNLLFVTKKTILFLQCIPDGNFF